MLILVMTKGVTSMTLSQKVILGSGIPVTCLFVIVGYLGVSCIFRMCSCCSRCFLYNSLTGTILSNVYIKTLNFFKIFVSFLFITLPSPPFFLLNKFSNNTSVCHSIKLSKNKQIYSREFQFILKD